MKLKVKLGKLSLCHCGYSLLRDDIKLGTVYTVETDTIEPTDPFTLSCGGCGCVNQLAGSVIATCITNPQAPLAKIPLALFDFDVKGAG